MRWTKLDLTCTCFKKIELTHHCFKSWPSICSSWIDCVFFFIFWPSKIRLNPTGIVSSLSPPRCRLSSAWYRHAAALCHTFFPWSQDELAASTSSSGIASSNRLLSLAEIEAFNVHHRRWPPFADRLTPTLHCYKRSSQSWSLSLPLNRVSILPPP
jgi:hypothetical protein